VFPAPPALQVHVPAGKTEKGVPAKADDITGWRDMSGDITFQVEESYRKVGFSTHDDFDVNVQNLTKGESEWLRGQIIQLIQERKP
jgi:hypothetical protein